jgi:SAM-dependent methyltransferase
MDYSGDIANIQQQLARCHDMVARRVAVLDALGPGLGEHVLEVGCGAGLYLREIAIAIGPSGSVLGIDVSPDQIGAATGYCADLTQVRADVGDVLAVPASDGEFDAALSVQVLEYVDDLDRALAEIRRVTRASGRFVNVATNWGALFWSGGDAALTAAVLQAWEQHAPHPNLPVSLPSRLEAHGFGGIAQRPVTIINRRFHPNSFSWSAARLMAAFAQRTGALDEGQLDAWHQSLRDADAAGLHFLSSVPVLTVATRLA